MGTWDRAQSVKDLACKRRDLWSILRTHTGKEKLLGAVAHLFNLNAGEVETDGSLGLANPGAQTT